MLILAFQPGSAKIKIEKLPQKLGLYFRERLETPKTKRGSGEVMAKKIRNRRKCQFFTFFLTQIQWNRMVLLEALLNLQDSTWFTEFEEGWWIFTQSLQVSLQKNKEPICLSFDRYGKIVWHPSLHQRHVSLISYFNTLLVRLKMFKQQKPDIIALEIDLLLAKFVAISYFITDMFVNAFNAVNSWCFFIVCK